MDTPEVTLAGLRQRADLDFEQPPGVRVPGRHRAHLAELGLQVTLTRSRYPNRPHGVDLYVVTISRPRLDGAPDPDGVEYVLTTLFGSSRAAEERPMGPLGRSFRVPATGARDQLGGGPLPSGSA